MKSKEKRISLETFFSLEFFCYLTDVSQDIHQSQRTIKKLQLEGRMNIIRILNFVAFHQNRGNEKMKFFKGIEVEEPFFLFLLA